MTTDAPATATAPAVNLPAQGSGRMYDLTYPGDDLCWYSDKPESVEAARVAFARHMETGALAYRTDNPENGGEQIRQFDPNAAVIVIARPLQGG